MMQQLHAVICALNSKYIHSSLAAWYLLAGIKAYGDSGVSAEVVEGTINESLEAVSARIIASGHTGKKPDVIGLSCYIWNIAFVKKLLPVLKAALPDAVIILGGPEVSYNAAGVLQNEPLVDYVLSGEGELPFACLLSALSSGRENGGATDPGAHAANSVGVSSTDGATHVSGITGVCYRSGGRSIVSPPYCSADDPPNPYSDAYFKALNGRIAYLETSRGCPFSCAFCLSGREQLASGAGGVVRFFNLERSKRDIIALSNSGTKTVKLVDRTFNAIRARALDILRFILDNYGNEIPKGVCFHFEIAGDLLDNETLELLSTAPKGAFQFEIGLQSFNSKTLEAINRKTNIGLLKSNIEKLIAFGNSHIHIDLIAGLPFEDLTSFAGSFNTAYALSPHMLQLGFLKLLHGAPMRENPDKYPCSYSDDPPYAVIETPWLRAEEIIRIRDAEDALERLYNSGRFRRTLAYVLKKTGLTPFELFLRAGSIICQKVRFSLDDYTALAYDFFSALDGVDKMTLRDAMACDRLSAVAGGKLPEILKIPDSRLKAVMTAVNNNPETRSQKNVKRGFALLYSKSTAVYVDYTEKDPVTGEYTLKEAPLPFSL